MTATELVYPVLGHIAGFICLMSLPLLALSLMHMIGKDV